MIRDSLLAPCWVNHTAPSGRQRIPIGLAPLVFMGITVNWRDWTSNTASLFPPELPIPPPSVIHNVPAGPNASFTGSDFSPGIGNSDHSLLPRSRRASLPAPPSATQMAFL